MTADRRPRRVLALLLCALVLFAALFIALEAEHDCTGEDCVVCALLCRCSEFLRELFLPGCLATYLLPGAASRAAATPRLALGPLRPTPVTLGVKLTY